MDIHIGSPSFLLFLDRLLDQGVILPLYLLNVQAGTKVLHRQSKGLEQHGRVGSRRQEMSIDISALLRFYALCIRCNASEYHLKGRAV